MGAWRTYRCENPDCSWFHQAATVKGKPLAHFYFWPDLRCECGLSPVVIRSSLPAERASLLAVNQH